MSNAKFLTATKPMFTPQTADQLGDRLQHYRDATEQWIVGNALELAIALAAGILIYAVTSWIKRRAARAVRGRVDDTSLATIALRAISRTSRFFRIFVAAELVNGFANAPEKVNKVIFYLFTVATVIQIAIWLREIILAFVERRAQQSGSESDTLSSAMALIRIAVSFALFSVAAIVILSNLGVNVSGLIAGLGVGGIAIGLAAQGIFSDLFAAISIIFDQPFRRGDTISYDTTTGRVEKIGMKSTRLRALSGEQKIISNSKLLEKEITNGTMTDHRRTNFVLGLVYQTPASVLSTLPQTLREIVEAEDLDFIRAGMTAFSPSAFDFQLVFDVKGDDLDQLFEARHKVALAIIDRFARDGIAFAYPTQTTFTAAPDGTLVMPFAGQPASAPKAPRKR
ncbi:mechanosensitive ion channel family protein [Sphingorhabdus sp.]|jgi:small-conductance mechanosensitive channel|uniref:mechanosensitive ion channel family protein n=3 Tax=Sphingorhabdus sp. TaxID=1902408 RepID=UPI003BB14BE1